MKHIHFVILILTIDSVKPRDEKYKLNLVVYFLIFF